MISLLGIGLLLCLSFKSQGQNSIKIKGILLDSLEQPMVGATVMLLQAEDSVMAGFSLTDARGRFLIQRAPEGKFVIQITRIGYGTFARPINLSLEDAERDLGTIRLNPHILDLDEVVIEGSFIPIIIKNDTIEYNANAFRTQANATVEDLLKKLPGIEVEKDGTVKAQGEEVQKVLVDGKEFFDDDPKIATRNIPADIVDKVQVFDKDSEMAEFTGIEDGNEAKTINLAIKEGKNKGWFGKVEAAYGLDDRYKGGGMVNRFNDKMQLSLIGNGNNTNEQAFSIEDYLQFSGGMEDIMSSGMLVMEDIPSNLLDQSGINEAISGGVNFNYDFSPKTKIRTNYFGNFTDNFTEKERSTQNLLGSGIYLSDNQTTELSQLTNHRGKLKLTHDPNDKQKWVFSGRIGRNENEENNTGYLQSLLDNEVRINDANQNRSSFSRSLSWQSKLNYMQKFKKKGRYISANLEWDQVDREGESRLNNLARFYANNEIVSTDTLQQLQTSTRNQPGLKAKLSYSEPLGKAKYLQFKAQYSNQNAFREKSFFDNPSQSPENWIKDELLSSQFDRRFQQLSGGPSFKIVRQKYNWTMGVDYQKTELTRQEGGGVAPFSRDFGFLLPHSYFTYSFTGTQQLHANYSTRTQIPSVDQMQPVLDNSNPLSTYVGNPDLQPEYRHQGSLSYSSFNQFYHRSTFLSLSTSWVQQKIINVQSINEQLQSQTMPINGGQENSLSAYYDFSSPIKGIPVKARVSGNIRLGSAPLVINTQKDRSAQTSISQTIKLENRRKSLVDIGVGYTLGYNTSRYQKSTEYNQVYLSHTWFSEGAFTPGDTWNLDVRFEYVNYSQEAFGDQQSFTYLDAALHKTFKDNQFDVYVSGKNLLNQDFRLDRNGTGNVIQQVITQQLGRIIMVGLIYKIRKFGG